MHRFFDCVETFYSAQFASISLYQRATVLIDSFNNSRRKHKSNFAKKERTFSQPVFYRCLGLSRIVIVFQLQSAV